MSKDKNNEKSLTETEGKSNNNSGLTDFDICELFISCNKVYIETASKLEIERGTTLKYAKELWKETIKTLKEARVELPR